jgi:hypothetical protein
MRQKVAFQCYLVHYPFALLKKYRLKSAAYWPILKKARNLAKNDQHRERMTNEK